MNIRELIEEEGLNPDEPFYLQGGRGFGYCLFPGTLEGLISSFIVDVLVSVAEDEGLPTVCDEFGFPHSAADPVSCLRVVLSKIKRDGSYRDKDDSIGQITRDPPYEEDRV